MLLDHARAERGGRERDSRAQGVVRIADPHAEPLGHGGQGAQVHGLDRGRVLGGAVHEHDTFGHGRLPFRRRQRRLHLRHSPRLARPRQAEGHDRQGLGHLVQGRHAGGNEQRPAHPRGLQQHGAPGQVARPDLDRRHVEACQEVQAVHVEGGGHEGDATRATPLREDQMVGTADLQRPDHLHLGTLRSGVDGLIGGLHGARGQQVTGREGLELDRVGAGFRRHIDHRQGVGQNPVMIDPRLRDHEHPVKHAPPPRPRIACAEGPCRRAQIAAP